MVQVHFDRNAVTCKIVYYGPGMSGKTTNLEIVHNKAPEQSRGEMVSIATRGDRTLYFDYLPLDLGQVQGLDTTFQLYTVPGQIYYNNTRRLVLQGVDGVVFVADSAADQLEANRESMANLQENLQAIGVSLSDIPVVIQYNKRDLANALPIAELNAHLNPRGYAHFEAIARDGQGVFVTLKEIGRQVIEKINVAQSSPRRRTGNAVPQVQPQPSPAQGVKLPPAAPVQPAGKMPVQAQKPLLQSAKSTQPMPDPRRSGSSAASPTQPMPRVNESPTQPMPRLNESPTQPLSQLNESATRPIPSLEQGKTSKNSSGRRPAQQQSASAASSGRRTALKDDNQTRAMRPPAQKEGLAGSTSPRNKHLSKPKPLPLAERQKKKSEELKDLGTTEPHLKKYRNQEDVPERGFRFIRFLLGLFLLLLILLLVLAVLTVFVPAVNEVVIEYLPQGLQDILRHEVTSEALAE